MIDLHNFCFGVVITIIIATPFVIYYIKDLKFYLRLLKALVHIHFFKKKNKKKFAFEKRIGSGLRSPYDVGVLPTVDEGEAEHPFSGNVTFQNQDGVHFTAIDFENNFIDVCINKITEHEATVWLLLKLQDGQTYSLPSSQDTRIPYIDHEGSFYASGLKIQCLSPMRRWRISFNSLLKKNGGECDDLVHVKFSFLWFALSSCKELNVDFGSKDLALGLLRASRNVDSEYLSNFSSFMNRYEQWGQLMGTLSIKGQESKEMYLWSCKTRISDFPTWEEDISNARFYMYFKDGFPLKLEMMSIKKLLLDYSSGYSIGPMGEIKNISDFISNRFISNSNNSKKWNCSFTLDKKDRKLQVEFSGNVSDSLYHGTQFEHVTNIRLFKVLLDDDIEGFGVLHHIAKSQKNSTSLCVPVMLLQDKKHKSDERLTVLLGEDHCESSLVSGGKGCSLSLLTKLAQKEPLFAVPNGIVVTTTAFEKHIKNNQNFAEAIQLLTNTQGNNNNEILKQKCLKCMKALESTIMSKELKNSIESSLNNMYTSLESVRFSVRSSACGEDSEDLSAAGQMLTLLGIQGINNIFEAVMKCWASKFGFEAVQYARQNGQQINSSMAVVIQEMVPSDVSGVMFTVDPVTGDPSHPYITANFGLGESVVSSLAEPDTIVLKRDSDGSLSISEKYIGAKQTQIHLSDLGGTERKTLDSDSESVCLSEEMAIRLGTAGILIESCYGFPLDIEWSFHQEKLFMLQARPITTLHAETEFELIHELDTPTMSIHDFWTRANTGEVYHGATSHLGISLIVTSMEVYSHVLRFETDKVPFVNFCPYFNHMLPVSHRQVFLNLIDVLYRINDEEINFFQKAFELGIFGRCVGSKEMHEAGVRKYGYKSTRYLNFFLGSLLMMAYLTVPGSIKKFTEKLNNLECPINSCTNSSRSWNSLLNELTDCVAVTKVHGLSSFFSFIANFFLIATLEKKDKAFDSEFYCDFATILSACTGIESADVPESLQELGKAIAANFGENFSTLSHEAAYETLKNDDGAAGALFRQFLKNHGHRCIKEFDMQSVSWGMNPESLIPILQIIASSPNILCHEPKKEMSTAQVMSSIKTPLTRSQRMFLKIIIPFAKNGVRYREKTKSLVVKCVNRMRQICHHLGAQMVENGMLPDKNLIFFLTLEEISLILNTRKIGLVSKAIRRQKLHSKLSSLQFPAIVKGIPKPISFDEDSSEINTSISLKGVPVCQGKVTAKCRVVSSLNEAAHIQNGEILITHSTDTGWTPYFPLLSGVVTVLGGLISHGAVVAREYGLPCVVGVQKATSLLKTGDIVILDGTNGMVTKVLESTDL